jgi:hypothetical protein
VPADCQALTDALSAQNGFGSAAGWSFIGAASIGIGTVIYALVTPRARQRMDVAVAPVLTPDGGALAVGGMW